MCREPNTGGEEIGLLLALESVLCAEFFLLLGSFLETVAVGEGLGPPLSCLVFHGTQELPSL